MQRSSEVLSVAPSAYHMELDPIIVSGESTCLLHEVTICTVAGTAGELEHPVTLLHPPETQQQVSVQHLVVLELPHQVRVAK
jgi:hypothetical protein